MTRFKPSEKLGYGAIYAMVDPEATVTNDNKRPEIQKLVVINTGEFLLNIWKIFTLFLGDKKGGLSAGEIAAIVLSVLFVLIAAAVAFIVLSHKVHHIILTNLIIKRELDLLQDSKVQLVQL